MQGVAPPRYEKLKRLAGVSRQTLGRWYAWWNIYMPATPFWKTMRGRFSSAMRDFPVTLVSLFEKNYTPLRQAMIKLLHFIRPLSTGQASFDYLGI